MGQVNPPWTAPELAHLAQYRFVPIDRNVANGRKSYRDNKISPIDEFAITTMKEVIAPQYVQIAWTQRRTPTVAPPVWARSLFSFSPNRRSCSPFGNNDERCC